MLFFKAGETLSEARSNLLLRNLSRLAMDSFSRESRVCGIAPSVGFVVAQTDPTIRTIPKIVGILTFMAPYLGMAETGMFKTKMQAFFIFLWPPQIRDFFVSKDGFRNGCNHSPHLITADNLNGLVDSFG